MSTVVVEIPDSIKAFLDEEIALGRGATHSELIQQFVRAEQKRRAHEEIKNLALEALETETSPWTKENATGIRDELRKRHATSPAK